MDITPHELKAFADRIEDYASPLSRGDSPGVLAAVRSAVPGSRTAEIASRLGPRLGDSQARLATALTEGAGNMRSATDALVCSDSALAASLGGG